MFCHKCGTQVPEDSGFCHKCGADLKASKASIQTSVKNVERNTATPKTSVSPQSSAAPVPNETQEVHDLLKKSAVCCPKIKGIALKKIPTTSVMAIAIKGSFYKYNYVTNVTTGKPSIVQSPSWLFYALFAPIALLDGLFLQFFFQGEYYPVLTICFLVGCIAWFPFCFFTYKERKEIASHINETLGCNMGLPSKVFYIVTLALNIIAIGFGIVSFVLY